MSGGYFAALLLAGELGVQIVYEAGEAGDLGEVGIFPSVQRGAQLRFVVLLELKLDAEICTEPIKHDKNISVTVFEEGAFGVLVTLQEV